VKADKRADVTIVGYMPSQKRAFASLLCAVEEGGALRFAGGVGTGFSDKRLSEINSALATIGLDKPVANLQFDVKPQRGALWVEPLYKAELAIGGWTREGQLRQARFLGWREDIAPVEAKPSPAPREARKTAEGDPLTRITHPERVMFPETGMTKRQVAEYYLRVAPLILPHLEGRPVSFVRAPEGIGEETFFQRHVLPGMKRGIVRVPDPRGDHKDYLAIDGEEGLITAAQFGVIEFHGWGARLPDLNAPDRVVFDLDPDEGLPFSAVRDAAFDLRKILGVMELQSFPMATGGKGVHVIVPLGRKQGWDEVEAFASGVARGLAATAPDRYVATMSKAKRTGKIFVDWLRNQRSATAILPWSLRARARSTIAAPVTWAALKMLNAANGHTALAFKPGKTPWPEFFKLDQSISPAALKYLRTFR
jgi:bifunctional non-homologous end joining protein LigD